MILAVDVGNTNIVLGGYEEDTLVFSTRLSTNTGLEPDQYALQFSGLLGLHQMKGSDITGCILSSVVPPLTQTLRSALQTVTGIEPMLFGQHLPIGLAIDIENPSELGNDLLAGAVGAAAQYALPAVVVDMGTATKLTAISAEGKILGVSIAPGVFLSLTALVSGASLLSGVAMQTPSTAIGRNTAASMQSGVVLGSASMLDGMLERFAAEMGEIATVVATGGAAGGIVPYCKREVHYRPTLILDGLYEVYRRAATQ